MKCKIIQINHVFLLLPFPAESQECFHRVVTGGIINDCKQCKPVEGVWDGPLQIEPLGLTPLRPGWLNGTCHSVRHAPCRPCRACTRRSRHRLRTTESSLTLTESDTRLSFMSTAFQLLEHGLPSSRGFVCLAPRCLHPHSLLQVSSVHVMTSSSLSTRVCPSCPACSGSRIGSRVATSQEDSS